MNADGGRALDGEVRSNLSSLTKLRIPSVCVGQLDCGG